MNFNKCTCNCLNCSKCNHKRKLPLTSDQKRKLYAKNAKLYSDMFLQTAEFQREMARRRKMGLG